MKIPFLLKFQPLILGSISGSHLRQCPCGLMDISFSPWVMCYFVAQVVLALAMRNSFKLTPVCQQTFYLFF